jgi:hypothetical protein
VVEHAWEPPDAVELPALLARFARPWWVAGGVAIELFCGVRFREHGDLDVEILRPDAAELVAALPGWELHDAVRGSGLIRWQPGAPLLGNSLWARPGPDRPWAVQFMLAHTEGPNRWVYRRDHRVGRPVTELGWTAGGLPVLRPEVELLYKSVGPRPRDDEDLDHALPLLGGEQVRWLAEAVATAHPQSPWRGRG